MALAIWFRALSSNPVLFPLELTVCIKIKPSVVNVTHFLSTSSYCAEGRVDSLANSTELQVATGDKNMVFRAKRPRFQS